jgi:hypothetical protein
MKIQILIFIIILQTFTLKSQILKSNFISNDTTWSSDTVKIYNDIVIENQATLQIDPGVYVEFQGNYSLTIYGRIRAIGTQYDTINFTIYDTTSFGDTATLQGGWGSIKLLDNTTDTSVFSYCRLSYGKAIEPGAYINDNLNEENMGGALFVKNYANLICNNSTFYHNRASWAGGALWVKNCSAIILRSNTFKENAVYYYGGGAILESCVSALISGNTFVLNRAVVFYQTEWGWIIHGSGGGLRININCNALVINNKFFNNHSASGSIYETAYNCLINNNIIANNMGGGIVNGHGNAISKYNNNIVVNNMSYDHIGCGMIYSSIFMKMRNNIIWGNDKIPSWPWDPIQLYCTDSTIADFTYMCNPDGYPGEGNIIDNPQFVNPTEGAGLDYDGSAADWSLQNSSPCVNTGTPDTTGLNLPEFDIAGNPRLYGIRVDMGAYENQVVVGLPKNPLVNSKIEIVPNPFKDRFSINLFGENKISRISVLNQSGITIRNMEQLPTDGFMVIDLNGYTSGLYLVVVEYNDGTRRIEKVLKK